MAAPVEYNATLTHKQLLTDKLAIFRVVADKPFETFHPGQYAILGLNHAEKGGVKRAYSIASPRTHAEYLEFYIRYVSEPASDNPLTHLLFAANEGDRLYAQPKIMGKFTVEDTLPAGDTRLRLTVAAGTGLAPFYSMAMHHRDVHGNTGPFAILHGASYLSDLGYREELEAAMNTGEAPRYLGTISRPKEAPGWNGLVGRAESHFEPERLPALEKALGMAPGDFNPRNAVVYICGLQGTIQHTLMNLLHRGFVPENKPIRRMLAVAETEKPSLFFEQYDTTPIIDRNDTALLEELKGRLRKAGVALGA